MNKKDKIQNGKTYKDVIYKHRTFSKKILIFSAITIIVAMVIGILFLQRNNMTKANIERLAEEELEQELINLNIEIKQETSESYKCLLTFISNNENEKIKSIEYPREGEKDPQIITVSNEEGEEKIGIDYEFKKNNTNEIFKVTTTKGNTFNEKTGYTITYDKKNGEEIEEKAFLKCQEAKKDSFPKKEGYIFLGWDENADATKGKYFRTYSYNNKEDAKLYAIWLKANNQSILGAIESIQNQDEFKMAINEEIYEIDLIEKQENLTLNGINTIDKSTLAENIYEFGNKDVDVAKSNEEGNTEYAQRMVVLKVNGDLTINEGVTLTSCKSDNGYGGPKGLLVYCTGTLTNNGTIDMTARGARAEGQNVYLWQNADGNYEYVPAGGANGGAVVRDRGGNNGKDGIARQTGGGASGARITEVVIVDMEEVEVKVLHIQEAQAEAGGVGTSSASRRGGNGAVNGGKGGKRSWAGGDGAGNPLGGTGGLLIIYSQSFYNNGTISSNGSKGYDSKEEQWAGGGGSGGGSINIFYKQISKKGTFEITRR